jgi:hypothetical protein
MRFSRYLVFEGRHNDGSQWPYNVAPCAPNEDALSYRTERACGARICGVLERGESRRSAIRGRPGPLAEVRRKYGIALFSWRDLSEAKRGLIGRAGRVIGVGRFRSSASLKQALPLCDNLGRLTCGFCYDISRTSTTLRDQNSAGWHLACVDDWGTGRGSECRQPWSKSFRLRRRPRHTLA